MILVLVGAVFVPAVSAEEQILDDKEVQNLISSMESKISTDLSTKIEDKQQISANKYLQLYDDELDIIVNQAMLSTKVQLSSTEQQTLKKLIIEDLISNMKIKKYETDNGLSEDSATLINVEDIGENKGYYTKYPVSIKSENGDMYTINFFQCNVDINGGSGWDIYGNGYTVNGNNNLYKIYFWKNTEKFTYKLWYLDEDHPNSAIDATYDYYRYLANGTYQDLALFTVKRTDSSVHLIECYNNGVAYAALTGIHATANRPWTSNIYVSNIWNHDIDVYDVNTNMAKSCLNPPYYLNMPTS